MDKLKKEWRIFKQDFQRQSNESLLFKFNWYVLKPLALVLVIITLTLY